MIRYLVLALLSVQLFAQFGVSKPEAKPADPPALSPDSKISVLASQHKLDSIEKQIKDLNAQYQTLQTQAKTQYETLTKQQTEAQANFDKSVAEAFKVAKLDDSKFTLDIDSLTFKPKTKEAPVQKMDSPASK